MSFLGTQLTTLSDEAFLMGEFKRGKPRAFELIFNKHYGALCYFSNDFLQDRDAAEDVVSEVFIKLWTMRDDFENMRAIKSFLYVSAKNACLNHLRRNRIIDSHKRNVIPDLLLEEQDDVVMGKIFEAEVLREVYNTIESLPTQCRRVLRLSLQGLSTEDIATTMGLSAQTVRNTKVRATEMLKKRVANNAVALALVAALIGAMAI